MVVTHSIPAMLVPSARLRTGSRVFTTLPSRADMNVPMPIVTSTHQRALVDTGSTVGEADCSATGALDKKIDSIDGGNGCADIAGRNREFYSVRAVDIQPPRANPTDMVTALPSINYRRLVLAGLVAIVVLLV